MSHLRRYRRAVSDSALTDDYAFDAATALHATEDPAVFHVDVHPDWTVGDKPNGGYLLALLGKAARTVARNPVAHGDNPYAALEVVATSITYLGAPELAPALIKTTVMRRGRTTVHVRAVLVQCEAELVDAVCVVSTLHPPAPERYTDVPAPQVPPPEDCLRLAPRIPGGVRVSMLETTELRLDAATLPLLDPKATVPPRAVLRGWTRFADGRPSDALSLLYFVDAVPPATMPIGSTGWVPTLQMSVYARALPPTGWLRIQLEAHVVADQMVDETCTLWDADGHVVAQATQLARVRFPEDIS
jgi:acyl-CoA thioesterase